MQAKEIVEQAKAEVSKRTEQTKAERAQLFEQAQAERKQAIEQAVALAESVARGEIEKLNAEGENQRQQLCDKARGKTDGSVAKVMDYLKNL